MKGTQARASAGTAAGLETLGQMCASVFSTSPLTSSLVLLSSLFLPHPLPLPIKKG